MLDNKIKINDRKSFKSLKNRSIKNKSRNSSKNFKIKNYNIWKKIDINKKLKSKDINKKINIFNNFKPKNKSNNIKQNYKSKIFKSIKIDIIKKNFINNNIKNNNNNNDNLDLYIFKNYLYNIKLTNNQEFLEKHNFDNRYRNKLIDWIIEVNYKYKYSDQCFFICVSIIDRYLEKTEKRLNISDLHKLGITSMYIAIKYEEIKSISAKIFSKYISHNKLSVTEIIEFENEILSTLNFELTKPNLYDTSLIYIKVLNLDNLTKKNQNYKFKKYFNFISKAILFYYNIISKNNLNLIIGAILYLCFDLSTNDFKEKVMQKKNISSVLKIKLKYLEITYDKIYWFIKKFKINYHNLENIIDLRKRINFLI